MSKMEKFGRVLKVIGGIAVAVGLLYVIGMAGASDMERYTHEYHSFGWLVKNSLIGLSIFISGFGVILASEKLIELSHKKFRKVLIRDTVSNKVVEKFVEDGSDIVLSDNEVVWKVSKYVYRFW